MSSTNSATPTDDTTGDQDERSPWTRPGFLASAGVVGLIVVLAVVLLLNGGTDPDPKTPNAQSPAPSSARAAGECGQEAPADATIPIEAPQATWRLVGTVAAPSSATAGPFLEDNGLPRCYAHDPTGALFSAANFMAATSDAQTLTAAVDQLSVPGPGRDAILTALATDPTSVVGTATQFQISGYTFLAYTPEQASLSLAIGATGGRASVPLTLQWSGTDWAVLIPSDGDLAARAQPISSLAGFTPWNGA
jgi:hypothetical protein